MAGAPAGEVAVAVAVGQAVQASSMDPDLVVRSISGPPSATPWTTIEIRVQVCNQGGIWAPPSAVAVVTSDDSVIDGLDPLLATAQVLALAPGGCQRVTAIGPSPGMFGRHVLGAIADPDQYVYEGDESNNAMAGSTLAVGHDPDLVVERVRGPVTAAPGAQIAIDVRVCNRGQSWTSGAGVELYLSTDDEITTSDLAIGWLHTFDLAPGACDDQTTMAWIGAPPGAHVLGAIVDPYDSLFELDEDNNAATGGALHVGWDPDLVITDIEAPPSALPGSQVSVSVTVCNQGQSPSSYSTIAVHVSDDDELDPMLDPPVGYFPVPYLEPAQCTTAPVPVSLYVGPEGAYRLGAVVDPWSSVPEIIEDNNQRLGDLIGVGYGPDLVVAGITGPHSSWPFESFQPRVRICNQGQGPSSSTSVRIFLSPDGLPEGQDGGQYPSPPLSWVPWLAPGACANVTGTAFAPGEPGGYVLGAIVDPEGGPQGFVPELIESNNAGTGQRVAVGYDADLVVTAVTPPPGTLLEHGQAIVSVRVCNHGRAPADGAPVELRVSRDPALSGDDMPVGNGASPWLLPDACGDVPVPAYFYVPEEGPYYLIAVVDPFDYVVEILDDNNTAASDRVGIGHSADLVVTSIAAPPSAQPGASFQVEVTVCNRGQMSSPFTEVELTASGESPAAPMFEVFLGQMPIPYLQQGRCQTARMPVSIHGPDGAYRLAATVDRWDYVSEILEDNNDFTGGLLGVGHGPDLVVTGVTGPTSWWPYEDFQATARVCNQGQGPSPGTSVRLFVSADGESESPSWPPHPGLAWVPWLAPGACANATGPVFAPGEPGGYVLGAVVDPEGEPEGWVPELIESNNTGTGQRIAIGHDPDLVVTAVTPPPGTLPEYGQAVVSARVCNHGRMPSPGAPVELRVSRDAVLSGDDMPAGQAPAPWLQPDTCADVPVHGYFSVPEEGGYYLIAVVDPYDSVIEILDDNNTGASGRVGIGHSADLVVTSIVAPPSALPGASIEVAVTVCNRGQMSSPFTEVEVTASIEPAGAPGFEVFLGQAPVPYMPPGQCQTVRMPAGAHGPLGVYRLAAVVDRWDYVSEILDDNNDFQGGVMGVGYDADLVVTALSGPPSALPGAALDLTVRVCNQGQGPTWGTPIEVYFSADSEIGPPADMPVGWAQTDHLAPAACADVPVTAYAHFEPGAYVLGAIVDPQRWVPELIEDNNGHAGARIGIGYDADLVVAQVSGPPSAQPWTDFLVTARVCNQGQGPSYGATLEAVLSADADVGAGDVLIGSVPVPMLEPGACHDLSTMAMAQVFSGAYTLGAVVRTHGESELIADNNARAGGLLGVGHDPDLVVTAMTGPASAPVFSEIMVAVEACNQGQGTAYGIHLDVMLSSDGVIDAGDLPVGSAWVDPLAPGACQTLNVSVYPFQPEGSYVLGARVDPMGQVWELIESNNATAGGAIELTPY